MAESSKFSSIREKPSSATAQPVRWLEKYRYSIVIIGLIILALGLIYWRIVRGYIPNGGWVHWPAPPDWVSNLNNIRWGVGIFLAAIGGGLIYLEARTTAVSGLLQNLLARRRTTVIAILGLSALLATFVFQPGTYVVADNRNDISLPWAILQLLRQGNLPVIWTTYVHMGSPLMQLHNSLYYYAAALLGWVVPNFFAVSEIMAFLILTVSALAIYAYVVELTGSALAGYVATVAWCGSFFEYQLVGLSGNGPLVLFTAFWPIQFYFIERALKSSRILDFQRLAFVALAVGLQIWTHVLHGAWMLPLGLLYVLIRVGGETTHPIRQRLEQISGLAGAHLVGALIGAYLIVPEALESHLLSTVVQRTSLGLESILSFDHVWGGAFFSYSILALAALGLTLTLICRYQRAYAIVVQIALLFLIIFGPHYVPMLNNLLNQTPLGDLVYARGAARYFIVVFGPLAALAGIGVDLLVKQIQRLSTLPGWIGQDVSILPARVAVLAVSLILAENIPLTLEVNYKSPDSYLVDSPGRWHLVATLAQTDDKTARILDMGEGLTPSFLYPMLTGHPGLSGNYEEAPPSFATSQRLVNRLSRDLESSSISPESLALLYQLNIGYLVTEDTSLQLSALDLIQRTDSATLWRVPYHAPVVATQTSVAGNEIPIRLPQGGNVPVSDINLTETAAIVTLNFVLPQPAFVQISYSAYPYQQVELDGQPIQTTMTALGLIGFEATAGEHTVIVQPELSPWRKVTLPISLATFVLTVGLALWPLRRS